MTELTSIGSVTLSALLIIASIGVSYVLVLNSCSAKHLRTTAFVGSASSANAEDLKGSYQSRFVRLPQPPRSRRSAERGTRVTQRLLDEGRPDAAWIFCRCRGTTLSPESLDGLYTALKRDKTLRPRHRAELVDRDTWFLATIRAVSDAIRTVH